jgi:hypothetical protein
MSTVASLLLEESECLRIEGGMVLEDARHARRQEKCSIVLSAAYARARMS